MTSQGFRFLGVLIAAALLAGCAGGPHGSSVLPTSPTTNGKGTGTATFVINVPPQNASAASRSATSVRTKGVRPQYLSTATQSIVIAISGPTTVNETAGLTVNSSGCTSSLASTICTLTVPGLQAGSYTATLTTYDGYTSGTNTATGNVLSAAQAIAFTITAGQSNTINIALSGVPASTVVVPADSNSSANGSGGYDIIGQGAHAFVAESLDADGNIIAGAGAPLFTIGTPSGSLSGVTTSPSTTSASAPNSFTVTPPATFASTTASFTVAPTFTGQATDGCTQTGANCAPVTVTVDMKYLLFAYDTNNNSGNVSAYTINATTGALTAVTGSPFAAGAYSDGVAVYPTGKFAYVTNNSDNNVSAYTINVATGALTPVAGSPFAAGSGPNGVAVDPTGKFAYIPNQGSNNVSAYTINVATGALTAVAGSPFAAGAYPVGVAVDPTGKFAYVANHSGGNVSAYAINATTGALTAVAGSPFAAGSGPFGVAVDPTGKFAYVTNITATNVSAYTINATTGALTAVTGSPFTAGSYPMGVAVDPTGKFAYVANQLSNNVSAYTINAATGALTPVAGSPFAAGANPNGVAVDPTGTFAYVANHGGGNVSAYAINATTGALTPVAGSPFTARSGPYGVAVGGIP
ncbi:MAG: beta-propeller fold lactonase family protein [Vulcanimicrobiaceae bacterium]